MPGRILVLDDEENYARMVQELLRKESFAAAMETRPRDAIETLRQESFDLVVADYKMPVMDGSEFLMEARKLHPQLPVIMISGLMNTPELVKVANIGVTVVLEKPLDVNIFLDHVRRFVQPETIVEEPATSEEQVISTPAGKRSPDLKYLATGAGPMGSFVHRLRDAVKSDSHVLVAVPPGSEFGLVTSEISLWRGCEASRPFLFTAEQLLSPATESILRRLRDQPQLGTVVVVNELEELDSGDQHRFHELVHGNPGGLFNGLTLVYEIRELEAFDRDDTHGAFRHWVTNHAVRVPPLTERLGDLAAYTRRYLNRFARQSQRPQKTQLTAEAMRFMLSYPWPGNFRELVETLRIAVGLGDAEAVEAEHLQEALEQLHGRNAEVSSDITLKTLLHRAQSSYLHRQDNDPMRRGEILKQAGADPSEDPDKLALLFPKLAEE